MFKHVFAQCSFYTHNLQYTIASTLHNIVYKAWVKYMKKYTHGTRGSSLQSQ